MYYTYLARCADGSLYTGYTNNLEKREKAHNSGKGSAYTRSRLPIKIVYFEAFKTRSAAMKREYKVKQMTKKWKETLVKTFETTSSLSLKK